MNLVIYFTPAQGFWLLSSDQPLPSAAVYHKQCGSGSVYKKSLILYQLQVGFCFFVGFVFFFVVGLFLFLKKTGLRIAKLPFACNRLGVFSPRCPKCHLRASYGLQQNKVLWVTRICFLIQRMHFLSYLLLHPSHHAFKELSPASQTPEHSGRLGSAEPPCSSPQPLS